MKKQYRRAIILLSSSRRSAVLVSWDVSIWVVEAEAEAWRDGVMCDGVRDGVE